MKDKMTSESFVAHKYQKREAQLEVKIKPGEEPVRLYAL